MSPRVSVIIPVHSVAPWIAAVVASVLANDVDLELIVVNDNTPDDAADIARRTIGSDPRGRVMDNQRRRGGDGARNTGLVAASAPYVVFLDGDDVLAVGGLEALLRAIDAQPTVAGVCGSFDSRTADGDSTVGGWEREHRVALASSPALVTAPDLAAAQLAPPPGAIIMRRDLVIDVGGWDEGSALAGLATDYELLARLTQRAPLALIDDVVLHYCVRATSLSRRRDHPRKFFRARLVAIRRTPLAGRRALARSTAARSWSLARSRLRPGQPHRDLRRGLGNASHALVFVLAGCDLRPTARVKLREITRH